MSEVTVHSERTWYRPIVTTSRRVAYVLLGTLLLVMIAEVFMRYAFAAPLGWNVSLIEKVLLPGIVFLGWPWARATAAHVSAGMLYERFPAPVQRVCRMVAIVVEFGCYIALLIGGLAIAVQMYRLGAVPPALSAQLPIPSWIWRTFLPLGAATAAVLIVAELVARRGRTEEQA